MADAAHPQLQQVLSDYKSPRKAALCGRKIICMCIARYDMVENQCRHLCRLGDFADLLDRGMSIKRMVSHRLLCRRARFGEDSVDPLGDDHFVHQDICTVRQFDQILARGRITRENYCSIIRLKAKCKGRPDRKILYECC